MVPTAIFLFDRTGNMARPWADAGYRCICYDIQHVGRSVRDGIIFQQWDALLGAPAIPADSTVVFGFAFPPCTDLAVSGARWFKEKGLRRLAQAIEMVAVADEFLRSLGVPYGIENPVSVISSHWRKPDYTFHPYEFTGFELSDNYTKKTCIWAGGGFEMPAPNRADGLGAPDNRIHAAPHLMTAVTFARLRRWDSPEQCLRRTRSSSLPEDHTMTTENSRADALTDRDTSKTNAEQGLYRKFDVRRIDGSHQPGGKHHDCEYFVLDITHDQHARAALRAYADACASTHPELSADLIARYALAPVEQPAAAPIDRAEMVKSWGEISSQMYAKMTPWQFYEAGWVAARAATPAPSPADERAAFEAHLIDTYGVVQDDDPATERAKRDWTAGWQAARAASANETGAEAVAWIRKHPDTGELSGDWLWDGAIEQCRKDSGVWFPLGFIAAPQPAQADARVGLTPEAIAEIWQKCSGRPLVPGSVAEKFSYALLAAHPGQPEPRAEVTEAEISAAARVLSDSNADLCYVDRDDNWKIHGDEFRLEAKAALEAAAAARAGGA
ncbi:hypothetical protein [Burkholderia seminalis]|uniref:hypothetical protein n=1 Tax=Burkholderia seminalis TaxID=488731 RepID=UPI002653D56A|nr:hypothetical protein [Burkholderia seminalis]MDN7848086.1 hypothetical protein [Burkholderia seminalis]